jgi:hypothetical protein
MTDKRAGIVMALISTLVLVLWLIQDRNLPAEVAAEPAQVASSEPETNRSSPRPKRANGDEAPTELLAYQALAGALLGKVVVLRCKLEADLDPNRDLFVPGDMGCNTQFSFPYSTDNGWLTTVVPAPSGSASLCDDWTPGPQLLPAPADGYLVWSGAGTADATCQLAQKRVATISGRFDAPDKSAAGHRVSYSLQADCGKASGDEDLEAGTYRYDIEVLDTEAQAPCNVWMIAQVDDAEQDWPAFSVASETIELNPAADTILNLAVTEADFEQAAGRNQQAPIKANRGLALRDVGPLLAKASPDNPEYALLKRMDRPRTQLESDWAKRAWADYDKNRQRWIDSFIEANSASEDEASAAFDIDWQNQLDEMEQGTSVKRDASGRMIGADGRPIGQYN